MNIAIIGLGNIGSYLYKYLQTNNKILSKKNNCTGIACDIRDSKQIEHAINETLDIYGKIDGVILNASALCLNSTLNQKEKEIDLMSSVNINGTFLMGQKCLEHIQKSKHGNMLIIA